MIEAVASADEVCGRTDAGAVECVALSQGRERSQGRAPARRWIDAGARQVVAGSHHVCALLEGDRVRCRGDDRFGQLGGRPRYVVTEPTAIPLEG